MKTRSWISSVCFSRCTVCIVYVVSDVIQYDMNWLAHISWENTAQCAVLIWRWFLIFTKVLYLYFELLSALCFRVEGHVCKRIIFVLFLQCCWRVCGGGRSCDVMRVFQLQCEALRETRRRWKICSAAAAISVFTAVLMYLHHMRSQWNTECDIGMNVWVIVKCEWHVGFD